MPFLLPVSRIPWLLFNLSIIHFKHFIKTVIIQGVAELTIKLIIRAIIMVTIMVTILATIIAFINSL